MINSLKVKVIAGAIALAASGTASAALFTGDTGNSSVILDVYDATSGTTFVKDLGLRLNDLFGASSTSLPTINLSTDSNWISFESIVAGAGGSVSNDIYNVVALDTLGNRYLTTTNASAASINTGTTGLTNAQLKQFATTNPFLNTTNTYLTGTSSVHTADGTADSADFNYQFQTNWEGKANFDSTATVGTALNFYQLSLNGTGNLTKINVAQNAAISQFLLTSDGLLTHVSPVPEAETWAMMLVGIGLIVSLRRRNSRFDSLSDLANVS